MKNIKCVGGKIFEKIVREFFIGSFAYFMICIGFVVIKFPRTDSDSIELLPDPGYQIRKSPFSVISCSFSNKFVLKKIIQKMSLGLKQA